MRSLHHIEVDRGAGVASFRTAVEFLRRGEAVGIFPEATISRSMELKEFKTGAVRIAAEAGRARCVPVIMWGTQRMMTKDHPKDFSRGKTIAISVGEPLHPTGADPVAETAELPAAMARCSTDHPRLPRRRAAAGLLVAARVVRRRARRRPRRRCASTPRRSASRAERDAANKSTK